MIRLRPQFTTASVTRRFRRLGRDVPRWTAQELNRQLRASKGGTGKSKALPVVGMTRRIQTATGVKPLRRIARRIRFPRKGFAKPNKLEASGLVLYEAMSRDYFESGIPNGAREVFRAEDPSGRKLVGGAFPVKLQSGKTGSMKRAEPKKPGPYTNPKTGHLPINWSSYVDISRIAYAQREIVLRDLALAWPNQMNQRFTREFRRLFGA